jgi:hypothetical protein
MVSVVADRIGDLEQRRERLYEQLAEVGDFRRGSVSENWRRCGKANCACAQPGHRGHGPRMLWTRSLGGGKSRARQLRAEEVEKVRAELATYYRFASLSEELVEVNEAICEARPPEAIQASKPVPDREKGGSAPRPAPTSKRRSPPK